MLRCMPMKYRLAEKGERTVYVEHGIWYDANTKHIHVTIPGRDGKAHWSYGKTHARSPIYKGILEEVGRWPTDAD